MIKTPQFWYKDNFISNLVALLLLPFSFIWIFISNINQIIINPYRSKIKVICIGNLSVGGTGKTPFAIYSYKLLKNLGLKPVFLTRGYGGNLKGPVEVKSFHTPHDVGDEAVLLGKIGTTIVSKNRAMGAKFIEQYSKKFNIILMDDGLQNNQLEKDIKILLVDKELLFGNKCCLPAGPLREPVNKGLQKVDVIILTGNNSKKVDLCLKDFKHIPVLNSNLKVSKKFHVNKDQFLAFCGLANPEKFFNTLEENKFDIVLKKSFPDHHIYSERQINKLIAEAVTKKLKIITTEKDFVKIEYKKDIINCLYIETNLDTQNKAKFKSLIKEKINA